MLPVATSVLTSLQGSPLSLQDAKTHLRVTNRDLDDDVRNQLKAAIQYCENVTGRTFHTTATYRDSYRYWCRTYRFNFQPVTAIDSVSYSDGDDATQSVDPSEYLLHQSTGNQSWLEIRGSFTFPTLSNRGDAVTINYTCSDANERAKQAIKLQLSLTWGDLTPNEATAYTRSLESLLASMSYGYR